MITFNFLFVSIFFFPSVLQKLFVHSTVCLHLKYISNNTVLDMYTFFLCLMPQPQYIFTLKNYSWRVLKSHSWCWTQNLFSMVEITIIYQQFLVLFLPVPVWLVTNAVRSASYNFKSSKWVRIYLSESLYISVSVQIVWPISPDTEQFMAVSELRSDSFLTYTSIIQTYELMVIWNNGNICLQQALALESFVRALHPSSSTSPCQWQSLSPSQTGLRIKHPQAQSNTGFWKEIHMRCDP